MGHYCGATTKKNTSCRRWLVNYPACQDHRSGEWRGKLAGGRGLGTVSVPYRFVAEIMASDRPLPRATGIIRGLAGEPTWRDVVTGWDPVACAELARAARAVLRLRRRVHREFGRLVADAAVPGPVGPAGRFCHQFLATFASRVGLPIDVYLIKAALGLRLAGIALCAVQLRDMIGCVCLRDLAGGEARALTPADVSAEADSWIDGLT